MFMKRFFCVMTPTVLFGLQGALVHWHEHAQANLPDERLEGAFIGGLLFGTIGFLAGVGFAIFIPHTQKSFIVAVCIFIAMVGAIGAIHGHAYGFHKGEDRRTESEVAHDAQSGLLWGQVCATAWVSLIATPIGILLLWTKSINQKNQQHDKGS